MQSDLPPLDAHAHIAGDVTHSQLATLGDAVVLAMTRSINEARYALRPGGARTDGVVWSLGVHPGEASAIAQFRADALIELLPHFAVVGEIDLDHRGDSRQLEVLRSVLDATAEQPVLLSIHSTGARVQVLSEIARRPQSGAILHWFTGTASEIDRAVELGCWFSVNAAMSDEVLRSLPLDRVLTETDFPSARRRTLAAHPGDVRQIEARLEAIHGAGIRAQIWRNFAAAVDGAGARHRLPPSVQSVLGQTSQDDLDQSF